MSYIDFKPPQWENDKFYWEEKITVESYKKTGKNLTVPLAYTLALPMKSQKVDSPFSME